MLFIDIFVVFYLSFFLLFSSRSFLCPYCAMGSARNAMDGSNCMVTCFNMNPVLLRWTTRSAYHIPGSAWEDCVAGVLCPCCTINQVLQTTAQFGHPHGNVGPEHNYHMFHAVNDEECCNQCLYATFCLPCAIGTSLSQSMGMPFFLGCCCSNFCIARNLLRYHYRMKGDDCLEDCLAPYGIFFLTYFLSPFIPCLACCTYPYFVTMVMLMTNEARVRGNAGAYLTPTQSRYANAVGAAATVTMAEPPPIAVVYAPFPPNENMKLERGRNI